MLAKGWVDKQGGRKGQWKTRWMVMEGDKISYYTNESKKNLKGDIDLKGASEVKVAPDLTTKPFPFCIVTPGRTWVLSVSNDIERVNWMNAIRSFITPPTKRQPGDRSYRTTMTTATTTTAPSTITTTGSIAPGPKSAVADRRATVDHGGLGILQRIDRSIKKNKTYLMGAPAIGQLFVSVKEAKFHNPVDPSFRPLCTAYFERQAASTNSSKNSKQPHWKESFLFEVTNIESRLKLKLYNGDTSEDRELSDAKIPIKPLEDGREQTKWYDMIGKCPGQILLQWRFEPVKQEEAEVFSGGSEVIGTAMLNVIGARGLKPRTGGAARCPYVVVKYGKNKHISNPVQNTLEPSWDYSIIIRVHNEQERCLISVEDMEQVNRPHLGTVIIPPEMLMNSAKQEEATERWIKLKVDLTIDNLEDNHVGGEIHVKYKFKPAGRINEIIKQEEEESLHVVTPSINYDDIPVGFPPPPPVVSATVPQGNSAKYKEYMKKKHRRDVWESALRAFQKKELESDHKAMISIVEDLTKQLKDIESELESESISLSADQIPFGFPELPPGVFEDSGPPSIDNKEEYKQYMKKMHLRKTWEDALKKYREKEKEGDPVGMSRILNELLDTLKEELGPEYVQQQFPVNFNDVPEGFPKPPPEIGEFNGSSEKDQNEYARRKMMRTAWESALVLYRKKESQGDTQAMNDIIQKFLRQKKAILPEARGVRRGGEIQLGARNARAASIDISSSSSSSRSSLNITDMDIVTTPTNVIAPTNISTNAETQQNEQSVAEAVAKDNSRQSPRIMPAATSTTTITATVTTTPSGPNTPRNVAPSVSAGVSTTNTTDSTTPVQPLPKKGNRQAGGNAGPGVGRGGGGRAHKVATAIYEAKKRKEDPNYDANNNKNAQLDKPIVMEPSAFSIETALKYETKHQILYKIVIIGDSGVGKTNLLGRWIEDRFTETSATINVEFASKIFEVNNKLIKVQFWDTAGQEQYRSITRSYYRKAQGAIVVYDISRKDSFTKLENWIKDVREFSGNEHVQILLLGNKSDLEETREVLTSKALEFAKLNGVNFLETSALSGENVNKAFQIVLKDIHTISEKLLRLHPEEDVIGVQQKTVVLTQTPQQQSSDTCCDTTNLANTSESISDQVGGYLSGLAKNFWS